MSIIIPPGYGHVAQPFKHASDPDPYVITFGVDLSDAAGDYQSAVDTIFGTVVDKLTEDLDSNVLTLNTFLYVGQDGGPPLVFESAGTPTAGEQTYTSLPQNCAMLVTKRTAAAGRRNRGRMYLPFFLPEGNVDETGTIDASHVTSVQADMTAFLGFLADGHSGVGPNTPMVILHSTGETSVPTPTVVTALTVENVIATQRRRLRK